MLEPSPPRRSDVFFRARGTMTRRLQVEKPTRRGPRLPIARPEPEPKKVKKGQPRPGAPNWPVRNLRPVVREDVTEKELVLLGIVRHFKELGFALSAYSSLV